MKIDLYQGLVDKNNINGSKLETDIKTEPRKVLITGGHHLWQLSRTGVPELSVSRGAERGGTGRQLPETDSSAGCWGSDVPTSSRDRLAAGI